MTVQYIGTTFPPHFQWGQNEIQLVQTIAAQIQNQWPGSENLLINTTWFGPQFSNDEYSKFLTLCNEQKFDNLFLLSGVDPICLTPDKIQQCKEIAGAKNLYLLGNFDNQYQFNFISTLLPIYFETYTHQQLLPENFDHLFLNYNRKPHTHRIELVDLLEQHNLLDKGVVTLGNRYTLTEQPNVGNWGMKMDLGIPHDIHTLGNMDIWRSHFLNVVSETEFLPWNNMFITEKTWKPIIGLRPFVINGQTQIYQYLRDNGFKTFNEYWAHVPIEDATELSIHDCIVSVIKFLSSKSSFELNSMWEEMLPDLEYNRQRFFEFAAEQKLRIGNLFT